MPRTIPLRTARTVTQRPHCGLIWSILMVTFPLRKLYLSPNFSSLVVTEEMSNELNISMRMRRSVNSVPFHLPKEIRLVDRISVMYTIQNLLDTK